MAQLRRKVTNLSQARFDRVNKPLSFSNSPKLSLDFIQASLVLPVFRNQQKLLQTTMVHPELICTNLWFQPTKSLLETKARCTSGLNRSRENRCRVCSTVLRPQIHLPTANFHNFKRAWGHNLEKPVAVTEYSNQSRLFGENVGNMRKLLAHY